MGADSSILAEIWAIIQTGLQIAWELGFKEMIDLETDSLVKDGVTDSHPYGLIFSDMRRIG
ncbi:uncharacterized protein G2W53_008877 [Senna tora]|uniref:RNase H type-1 domain-containing protein n=1 Tax=Senna tora TaxID=362788 RepID=A0A834WXC0_9FABA|nr:uncharacterized protein G2W53_008877 [Senna tora]